MKKLEDLKKIIDVCLGDMDISSEARQNINEKIKNKKTNIRRFTFITLPVAAAILVVVMILNMNQTTLHVSAKDLMEGITPSKTNTEYNGKSPDKASADLVGNNFDNGIKRDNSDFINSVADFSIDLFKQARTKSESSLISPFSVYLALAMTGNGADDNTLKEFETVLGNRNLKIEDINGFCYSLSKKLEDVTSGKFNIANSIWYRQDDFLHIERSFLQKNADYYNANIYQADFNSKRTVDDINNWVSYKTKGLIDKIIEDEVIPQEAIMYLINTLYFQANWQGEYKDKQIKSGDFILENGDKVSAKFMSSTESNYLEDKNAQGFIKAYKDNKFSFVALLPDEGLSIDEYIDSLTGTEFLSLIKNKSEDIVQVSIPQFKTEYSNDLKDSLISMGLKDAFSDAANFKEMGSSDLGNIFINRVLHKTFIKVDSHGTEAAAVTAVEVMYEGLSKMESVILNRPFVYAIIDNETSLPIFLGTMQNPSK